MNRWIVSLLIVMAQVGVLWADDAPVIKVRRAPDGGVQPQAAVDSRGRIHLIYLRGPAEAADIYYVHSDDGGETFSPPRRVNGHDGSAMAVGTVRGPHLAVGKAGRPHVAWMGSAKAEPKAPDGAQPFLYTRLADTLSEFEPERNVLQVHAGLDGGGSLAADETGRVCIAWHAPSSPKGKEASRQVWLVRSTDEGQSFGGEAALSPIGIGGCGCCGMRLGLAADGTVLGLFRSAEDTVNRDMYLLASPGPAAKIVTTKVAAMTSGTCVMSTAAMAPGPDGSLLAAWETNKQIYWASIHRGTQRLGKEVRVPQEASRKHPALAANQAGQVLVAWAEGTAWLKGGAVAWQLFDNAARPIKSARGRQDGLPVWGLPAVAVRPDGGFLIVY